MFAELAASPSTQFGNGWEDHSFLRYDFAFRSRQRIARITEMKEMLENK